MKGGSSQRRKKMCPFTEVDKESTGNQFCTGSIRRINYFPHTFFPPWSNIILLPKFLEFYGT